MKFIQVTKVELQHYRELKGIEYLETTVYIDPEKILCIEVLDKVNSPTNTFITVDGNSLCLQLSVKETSEEILEKINSKDYLVDYG